MTFSRARLALECCGLLAVPIISFDICLVVYRKSIASVVLIAHVPAIIAVTIIFLLVTLHPGLSSGPRVRFPMNLTLPTMMNVIAACVATLFTASNSDASQFASRVAPMRMWQLPDMIGLIFVCQIIALSLVTFVRNSGDQPSLP